MALTLEEQLHAAMPQGAGIKPMIQSEKELVDLIKLTNPGTAGDLTYENIILSKAGAVTGRPDNRNSMVVVAGIPEKGVAEKPKTVYYWRVDLGVLFQKLTPSVGVTVVAGMTTHDLVPAINAKYGTTIDIEDIVKTDLVIDPLPGTATIKAVDGNVKYIGEFAISFDNSAIHLQDVILIDTLLGFNYPSADLTKGQATLYSYSFECPEESEVFWGGLTAGEDLPTTAEDHINLLYGLDNSQIWRFTGDVVDYNLTGSTVKYAGVNDQAKILKDLKINTNPIFENVAIFQLGAGCKNFAGLFVVGWGIKQTPPAA